MRGFAGSVRIPPSTAPPPDELELLELDPPELLDLPESTRPASGATPDPELDEEVEAEPEPELLLPPVDDPLVPPLEDPLLPAPLDEEEEEELEGPAPLLDAELPDELEPDPSPPAGEGVAGDDEQAAARAAAPASARHAAILAERRESCGGR